MILDAAGKPIVSAEETFQSKKVDTYYDKVFVRHLIHRFQGIDPEVGAVWYPHTQCVVFWWYGIILYKVMLTEHNVDEVSIQHHMDTFRMALQMVKTDPELRKRLADAAKGHNKKFAKTL